MQDLFERVEKMKEKVNGIEKPRKKEVEIKDSDLEVDESLFEKIEKIEEKENTFEVENVLENEKDKKGKKTNKKKNKEPKVLDEKQMKRSVFLKEVSFYICAFLVYCFIGWVYEVIWEFKVGNGFVNRGFLYGPYLPIYGFGVLTLYFILKKPLKTKIKIGKINIMPIFVFIAILVVASLIEYVVSFGMEVLFQKRWWDYSYDFLNINGRVSLRNSSLLAIGAFVLLYGVQPILEKTIRKINGKVLKVLATIIVLVVGVDFIITMLGYANIITI